MDKQKIYVPLHELEDKEKMAQAEKLAKVKLLLIDIDGTLRDDDNNIEEKTPDILRRAREAGIECVMTTGRPRVYPERWYNAGMAISPWVISAGGSEIYNCETKQVFEDHPLDSKLVKSLYRVAAKYNSMTQQDREKISPWFAADNSKDSGLRVKFVGEGKNVTTILKDPAEESVFGKDGDTITFKGQESVVKNGKVEIAGNIVEVVNPDEFFKDARITQVMVGSNNFWTWQYLLNKVESPELRNMPHEARKKMVEQGDNKITLPFYEKALVDETHKGGKLAADIQVWGTNKGAAAEKLAEHFKIEAGQIAMFGNAMNDIVVANKAQEMGGFAIAVGDATDDYLEAADIVVGKTCAEGAVGFFLEEMIEARELVKNKMQAAPKEFGV